MSSTHVWDSGNLLMQRFKKQAPLVSCLFKPSDSIYLLSLSLFIIFSNVMEAFSSAVLKRVYICDVLCRCQSSPLSLDKSRPRSAYIIDYCQFIYFKLGFCRHLTFQWRKCSLFFGFL